MTDARTTIISIRMENFGYYRDTTIDFTSGFNQLTGPNESGKSTVVKAILTALFEDGSTTKKSVASLQNWTADQPFRLTLVFTVGDRQFTLVRDHAAGRDVMTDSAGLTYEGKAIGEKLNVYFGTLDKGLFESIFCFSSDNPAAPEATRSRLQSALEMPVFSGFDRLRADRYLDEEIKKLDNPRAHGPRELDVIGEQITGHLQEKSDLENRLEALRNERKELEDVRDKVTEHESRVAHLDREVEGALAYHNLNIRMANLEERLQVHLVNYSRAAQVAEDMGRIEQELSAIKAPEPGEMLCLTQRRDELNLAVGQSKQRMDEIIVGRAKANRGFLLATLLLVILCLAYVFQQNGYISSDAVAEILPFTIPVMAIVWLFRMGVYFAQFHKKRRATAVFRQRVADLDSFYAELNGAYRFQAADPVKALEEKIQRRHVLEVSARNLRETIDILSENRGLPALDDAKKHIESEVAQLNQELAPLTTYAASAARLSELKEELVSRRVRANALRERAALLTERCSAIDSINEKIIRTDGAVEGLKRKHKDITEQLEVLKVTRLALNRAADQLIEDTFAAYSSDASAHLLELTDGRYDQVRFSKDPGRFEVKIRETGRWLEITDALSSSTRDCIYLALRLAAAAHLGEGFACPMIFDQPETRMDIRRRESFFALLMSISRHRQVLYLVPEKIDKLVDTRVIMFERNEIACHTTD